MANLEVIKRFISSLQLDPELKAVLSSEKLLVKHEFYWQLPQFLAPAFSPIAEDKLYNLIGYSYLYFRFTLEVDQLLDKPLIDSTYPRRLLACLNIHEHAIRGLSQLFSDHQDFWPAFNLCKDQYIDANLSEKQIAVTRTGFSKEIFENIAKGKSAICYAVINALSSLSQDIKSIKELYKCLEHLHIAMQYIDDIEDFKQDWQEGQFTYAHSLVEGYLVTNAIPIKQLSVNEIYKYFHTSGIIHYLLDQCQHHFGLSLEIANSLGLSALALYPQRQLDGCMSYQREINQLVQKTKVKASKSFALLHKGPTILSETLLQNAINKAIQHLHTSRDSSSCWLDFLTSAGQSKMWTTAYAGLLLAETKVGFSMAHEAFDASFFLPKSYNEGIMQDGDSTNFGMGLQRRVWGDVTPEQIKDWLAFMDDNGGWVTYRNADQLRELMSISDQISVADWLTPKLCVTAAATYVLMLYKELEPQYLASCDYLVRQQHTDGYWSSYWWTSPIYATAFATLALAPLANYTRNCEKALEWLVIQQDSSGAWYDDYNTNQPSAFYTSLAIKALLVSSKKNHTASVKRGIDWLVNNQMSDGSWLTTRILRIPDTNISDPSTINRWRPSSFGVNIIVDDHNRVFTTSTAFNVLSLYNENAMPVLHYS